MGASAILLYIPEIPSLNLSKATP